MSHLLYTTSKGYEVKEYTWEDWRVKQLSKITKHESEFKDGKPKAVLGKSIFNK